MSHFNGSHYNAKSDDTRLSLQHLRIKELMLDGKWRTLSEIAQETGDPPASISAQLRHLRKPRFGSWIVEVRSRGERATGLYEYRLLASDSSDSTSPTNIEDGTRLSRHEWLLVQEGLQNIVSIAETVGHHPDDGIAKLIKYVQHRAKNNTRKGSDDGLGKAR